MNKAFTLNCGEFTFILRKEDVKFYNGYGIVKPKLDSTSGLIGVVDKDYKIVLPLTSEEFVSKLFIAPKGNFIFGAYISEQNIYQVFHIDIDGNEINLGANDFIVLDDEVIQLNYDNYSVLYDTQIGDFLTPFYHCIGSFTFDEKYGCKVAKASFYNEDENGNIINEVRTIINIKGEVLENYLVDGTEIESRDLSLVLDLVRRRL